MELKLGLVHDFIRDQYYFLLQHLGLWLPSSGSPHGSRWPQELHQKAKKRDSSAESTLLKIFLATIQHSLTFAEMQSYDHTCVQGLLGNAIFFISNSNVSN